MRLNYRNQPLPSLGIVPIQGNNCNGDISTVDLNSPHPHFGTAGDGKLIPQKFFSTASASRNSIPYV
jgi:hypothetical protein